MEDTPGTTRVQFVRFFPSASMEKERCCALARVGIPCRGVHHSGSAAATLGTSSPAMATACA
jgi:hypothetical protein